MSDCVECGRPVPKRRRGFDFTATDRAPGWFIAADPWRLFCTLRCAARYGIRTAEKRIRGEIPPEKRR